MRPLHKLREKLNRVGRRTGNLPIRVRLFLITFGVILLFLVIIFSSNTLLLQPYYNYMKEKKLTSTLLKISALDLTDADDTGYASDKLAMKLKSCEEDGNIRMINILPPANTTVDRIIDLVPQVIDRVEGFINKQNEES